MVQGFEDLGFRVWGLGFLGFRVYDLTVVSLNPKPYDLTVVALKEVGAVLGAQG